MKQLMNKIVSLTIIAALLTAVSITSFNAVTLYKDGDYTYADIDERYVALYNYEGSSSTLVIPDMYNKRYVRSVYNYAFENNTKITGLDFSETTRLNAIGNNSFAGCTGLSGKLVLPTYISSLGRSAFQGCTNLSEVEINCTAREIPIQLFNRCTNLETVYLSIYTESIGNLAFANCPNLRDVYLPENVLSISNTAFLNSYDIVFHCFYGSYAHQYAIDNNIPCVFLDGYKIGDVNLDGSVDIVDATWIQQYLAEMRDFDENQLSVADTNEDGEINILDATEIQIRINLV